MKIQTVLAVIAMLSLLKAPQALAEEPADVAEEWYQIASALPSATVRACTFGDWPGDQAFTDVRNSQFALIDFGNSPAAAALLPERFLLFVVSVDALYPYCSFSEDGRLTDGCSGGLWTNAFGQCVFEKLRDTVEPVPINDVPRRKLMRTAKSVHCGEMDLDVSRDAAGNSTGYICKFTPPAAR